MIALEIGPMSSKTAEEASWDALRYSCRVSSKSNPNHVLSPRVSLTISITSGQQFKFYSVAWSIENPIVSSIANFCQVTQKNICTWSRSKNVYLPELQLAIVRVMVSCRMQWLAAESKSQSISIDCFEEDAIPNSGSFIAAIGDRANCNESYLPKEIWNEQPRMPVRERVGDAITVMKHA